MKKLFASVTFILLFVSLSFTQDVIISNDGTRMEGKIFKEDSVNVYFTTKIRDGVVETFINRENIKEIIYERDRIKEAAEKYGKIQIEQRGMGYRYFIDGKPLLPNELPVILQTNSEAYEKYRSARSTAILATVFSSAGGFLIGYPLGTALGGGEPNWAIAGVGAGLVVIAIPITQSANKKANEAVKTYNKGLQDFLVKNTEIKLGITAHGIGLRIKF
jgi:hypothetical protein